MKDSLSAACARAPVTGGMRNSLLWIRAVHTDICGQVDVEETSNRQLQKLKNHVVSTRVLGSGSKHLIRALKSLAKHLLKQTYLTSNDKESTTSLTHPNVNHRHSTRQRTQAKTVTYLSVNNVLDPLACFRSVLRLKYDKIHSCFVNYSFLLLCFLQQSPLGRFHGSVVMFTLRMAS